jgi:outer membrane cobalamin receptor
MFRVIVGLALVLGLSADPLLAQGGVTTVSGTVKDASGGVLPGATVDIVIADRASASATTDSDGRYRVQAPAGVPLELRVRLEGFADQVIKLNGSDAAVTRDVTLQIGRVSDTLVVTASRGAESRANVTQAVAGFTAEDIEALGSTSIVDVVRFVPGLNADGNGREGGLTSVFSRGGESDYNLVLIDGVRVNANGGAFDFGRIAAGEIDRVEVVRGAQSALYGSDAIGSVIQIFTKRAQPTQEPRVSGNLEGGSFNTFRGDVNVGGGALRRLDYHAGVTYRSTDGAFQDILVEDDVFEQVAFNGSVGASLGNRASLRTALRTNRSDGRAVGPIAYAPGDTGTAYDTRDLSWHLDFNHSAGEKFTGTANLGFFRTRSANVDAIGDPSFNVYAILDGTPGALFPEGTRLVRFITQSEFASLSAAGASPGGGQFLAATPFGVGDFPFTSRTDFQRPAVKYQGDFVWAAGQRLSAGYEWERESDLIPEVDVSLDNNAFFVQQQISLMDRWFVSAGARVDRKESYDTFVSPKLSAGGFVLPYRAGPLSSVKVFGNIGKGIKSPSLSERLGASFSDPNPDLKVERARTADIGVEATFASQRLRASAIYFDNDFRDMIAFRFGAVGDGIPEFINIDGSEAHGVELDLVLQRAVAGFTASASYARVDSEVLTDQRTNTQFQPGQPLLRRPQHSGTLRLSYSAGPATVNFDTRFVGKRHDGTFLFPLLRTVPNAAMPLPLNTDITVTPGYVVSGLGVDVRAHDQLTVFVRANNIADTDSQSGLGWPGLPRHLMAGVRFSVGR